MESKKKKKMENILKWVRIVGRLQLPPILYLFREVEVAFGYNPSKPSIFPEFGNGHLKGRITWCVPKSKTKSPVGYVQGVGKVGVCLFKSKGLRRDSGPIVYLIFTVLEP